MWPGFSFWWQPGKLPTLISETNFAASEIFLFGFEIGKRLYIFYFKVKISVSIELLFMNLECLFTCQCLLEIYWDFVNFFYSRHIWNFIRWLFKGMYPISFKNFCIIFWGFESLHFSKAVMFLRDFSKHFKYIFIFPNNFCSHFNSCLFCFSQLVFLHCDRYVEFHSQHGHYYRTRIPKFGRDFSYHYPSCDLYFVGARCANAIVF